MSRDTFRCVNDTLGLGPDKKKSPISDDELKGLIAKYKRKQMEAVRKGLISSHQAASEQRIAEELAKEARMSALAKERTAKFNLAARVAGISDIGEFKSYADGLDALMQGSKKRVIGSRNSVQGIYRGYRSMFLGQFIGELYREGVFRAILPSVADRFVDVLPNVVSRPIRRATGVGEMRAVMDEDIALEMEALSLGNPGVTKNEAAAKIAKVATKYFDLSLNRLNRLGAWIGKTPGYVIAQSHDMMKIREVSKEDWIKFIRPLLDEGKTFDALPDLSDESIGKFLGDIYDELSHGLWYKAEDGGGYKAGGNLARKISSHRVLHFGGARKFVEYNKRFGVGGVFEGMIGHLERAARTASLMERFGPSWRDNMHWLREHFAVKAAEAGHPKKDVDRLKDKQQYEILADVVDGTVNIPSNVYHAAWQQGYLRVQRMASLGLVMWSSLGDTITAASDLRFQGMSFGGKAVEHTANILSQIGGGNENLRTSASHLGVGLDVFISSAAARADFNDSIAKTLERTEHTFFWSAGMNWMQGSNERSMSAIMSHNLATNADLPFDALDPQLSQLLTFYKIGAKEWDVLRRHAVGKDGNDNAMMFGDTLRLASPEAADPLVDIAADELADKALRRFVRIKDKMAKTSARIQRLSEQLGAMGERADAAAVKDVKYTVDALNRQQKAQQKLMDHLHKMATDTQPEPIMGAKVETFEFNKVWKTLRREMEFLSKAEVGIGKKWADGLRRYKERAKLDKKAEPAVLDAITEAADDLDALRKEIEGIPADFDKSLEGLRLDALNGLERRLQSFFADRTAVGVPRAGIKEQVTLTGNGQRPGTGWGFAARAMMQFKGYGMAFNNEVLGRFAQEDKFFRVLGGLVRVPLSEQKQLAALIVTLSAVGYMSLSAKQILKGRTPPELVDEEGNPNFTTMGRAMVQGGGFGLYGDFLSANANRFGESILATVGGPIAGDVEAVGKILIQTRSWANGGNPPDDQVWNLFKNNTPFINLFYTRAALDYLILYDIQEALSPGSLQRMERRMQEESGQEFFAPPSENRVKLFTE